VTFRYKDYRRDGQARYGTMTLSADHRPPCPCCGGRMIIVEVFAPGSAPRGPPSSVAGIQT
jgi:hypothetical protein